MAMKALIQTLNEIPDLQLLIELQREITKEGIILGDIKKLFSTLSNLFQGDDDKIIAKTHDLLTIISTIILQNEVQMGWSVLSRNLIRLLGRQNQQIRRKTKQSVLQLLKVSGNVAMVLQGLLTEGLDNGGRAVAVSTLIFLSDILSNSLIKNQIPKSTLTLILQRVIRQSQDDSNSEIMKRARQLLQVVFHSGIQVQVIEKLDPYYKAGLQKIWSKLRQQLIYKKQTARDISYQQLSVVNDKIFGVYQPFTLKNVLQPPSPSAYHLALTQLRDGFMSNVTQLTRYSNVLTKITMKLLPKHNEETVQLLGAVLSQPGVCNIVNMQEVIPALLSQLGCEQVAFRKQLKECLCIVNGVYSTHIVDYYSKSLLQVSKQIDPMEGWIQVYELMQLAEHWLTTLVDTAEGLPPTLDTYVVYMATHLDHPAIKLRNKNILLLGMVIEQYPSYRETLFDHLGESNLSLLEDQLQRMKKKLFESKDKKQAKCIFMKEMKEARKHYLEGSIINSSRNKSDEMQ